jgi:hypothetical protein
VPINNLEGSFGIAQITYVARKARSFLQRIERIISIGKIVENGNRASHLYQGFHQMTADKSSTTRYEAPLACH